MLQILIVMIALGVLGILMCVALPPGYKWGGGSEYNVDAPTDNAFWTQLKPMAVGNNGPTQITVAPPYIILGVRWVWGSKSAASARFVSPSRPCPDPARNT